MEDEIVRVEDVNMLINFVDMKGPEIIDLSQCTSSFFVLVFQHLFTKELPNLELDVDTTEKKLHNVRVVIEAVEELTGTPLRGISPEAIIAHNEIHISRLIRVFMDIVANWKLLPESTDSNPGNYVDEGAAVNPGQLNDQPAPHGKPRQDPTVVKQWFDDLQQPDPHAPNSTSQTPRVHSPNAATPAQNVSLTSLKQKDVKSRFNRISQSGDRIRVKGMPVFASAEKFYDRNPDGSFESPAHAYTPTNLYRLDKADRDAKIERLRAKRFTNDVYARVAALVLREEAEKERVVRERLRQDLAQQRRDHRDLLRFAKEEDVQNRKRYVDCIDSAAQRPLDTLRDLSTQQRSKTTAETKKNAQRVKQERLRVKRTQAAARIAAQQQQRSLDLEYKRYLAALTSWY